MLIPWASALSQAHTGTSTGVSLVEPLQHQDPSLTANCINCKRLTLESPWHIYTILQDPKEVSKHASGPDILKNLHRPPLA